MVNECDDGLPVDGDGDHVHEGAGHVAVEEEGEHAAECRAQGPCLVDIPGHNVIIEVICPLSWCECLPGCGEG